jgi:hypothetical protein
MVKFRHEPEACAACAAKDQTIVALADQIDWLRAQIAITQGQAATVRQDMMASAEIDKKWLSDEEEDLEFQLEQETVDAAQAERALAAIQAQNAHIQLVK